MGIGEFIFYFNFLDFLTSLDFDNFNNLTLSQKSIQIKSLFFKQYSNYFYENQDQYQKLTEIELSEEKIEITDDDFQNFISSYQNQKFQISDSNVFEMYQLSSKYNVPSLLKITKEYIEKNH